MRLSFLWVRPRGLRVQTSQFNSEKSTSLPVSPRELKVKNKSGYVLSFAAMQLHAAARMGMCYLRL